MPDVLRAVMLRCYTSVVHVHPVRECSAQPPVVRQTNTRRRTVCHDGTEDRGVVGVGVGWGGRAGWRHARVAFMPSLPGGKKATAHRHSRSQALHFAGKVF